MRQAMDCSCLCLHTQPQRCTALPAAGVLVVAYISSQRIDSLPAPLQQRIRAHLRADSNEATESIAISKLVAYNIDSWFSTNPVSLQGFLAYDVCSVGDLGTTLA